MTLWSPRRTSIVICLLTTAATLWPLVGAANAAGPSNTALPTISGTAQQGQTLALHAGTWTDAASPTIGVSDQWNTCMGATCSPISPAPGAAYTLTAADVGRSIEVVETATAADGSASVNSAPTAAVASLPPVNSAAPSISGTPQVGHVLTLSQGQWSNSPTITDQWQDCDSSGLNCKPTVSPTGPTYTVGQSDVGSTIAVLETATNTGGVSSASSAPTSVIVAPPTEISAPSISGTTQQGDLLTESHGTWSGNPTSYSYQWTRCVSSGCAIIPGATAPTYTLTASDLGATIAVAETASNAGGPSAPFASALTGVVTTPAGVVPVPGNTAPPTVSGLAEQGHQLLVSHGAWSANPGSYRYQWESCGSTACTPIPGATDQTYTPAAADVGQTIFVRETATNAGGSGAPASSARTAVVNATSVTSMVVSPAGPRTNQIVTLVATVSSSSANANPGGSVTFFDGAGAISGCTSRAVKSAGQSVSLICQDAFPAGAAALRAVYTPSPGLAITPSASPLTTLAVGRDSTATSLAVTKQVVRSKRASFTATLGLPAGNSEPIHPTGSVEFLDGGRAIPGCLSRPLKKLTASCAVRYRSLGKHTVSARYTGDTNFAPSAAPIRSVRVVTASSQPPVLGFVSSTLQWQFFFHPAYTQVTLLRTGAVRKGVTLLLTCAGKGCPFNTRRIPGTGGPIDLLPAFHQRHLAPGSEITVRMTRPNWIGKYYSFTARPGRAPVIVLSCLGIGKPRPGVGC
jgi:Big-like domain-containing protein